MRWFAVTITAFFLFVQNTRIPPFLKEMRTFKERLYIESFIIETISMQYPACFLLKKDTDIFRTLCPFQFEKKLNIIPENLT